MTRRLRPLHRAAEIEDRLWMALDAFVPTPVRAHLRSARREVLLALREILDYAIERTEGTPRRPRRVRVE